MNEERQRTVDSLEDLKGLRLGRPDPALRQRTLGAVRAVLAGWPDPAPEPEAAGHGWGWWREWRLEAALAAGIAVCALLLPALGRLPADLRPPSPPATAAVSDHEAIVDQLGLDELKPYIRIRQAIARRLPEPEPRTPYHERTARTLDLHRL